MIVIFIVYSLKELGESVRKKCLFVLLLYIYIFYFFFFFPSTADAAAFCLQWFFFVYNSLSSNKKNQMEKQIKEVTFYVKENEVK